MREFTKEQYIEYLKAKLRKNITHMKYFVSDFSMTEAGIDRYVRERIDAHLIAKTGKSVENDHAENTAKAASYLPANDYHPSIARTPFDIVKNYGTVESEKYNKMVFEDLTRDDEIGDRKMRNYYLLVLNAPFKVDRELLKTKKLYSPEVAKYAVDNLHTGNLCHGYNSVFANPVLKPRDEEKFEVTKRFAENIGALFCQYHDYYGSEESLTVPLDVLSDEQYQSMFSTIADVVGKRAKNQDQMELLNIADFASRNQAYILSARQYQKGVEDFEKKLEQSGREGFTNDDLVYADGKEPVRRGGFQNYVNVLMECKSVLDSIELDDPDYASIHSQLTALCNAIKGDMAQFSDADLEKISSMAAGLYKETRAYEKKVENSGGETEAERQAREAMEAMGLYLYCIRTKSSIRSKIFYQLEDNSGVEKDLVGYEEVEMAWERAEKSKKVIDYDDAVERQTIRIPDVEVTGGFIYVTDIDIATRDGYHGRIDGDSYIFSERFDSLYSRIPGRREDSPEMARVRSAVAAIRELEVTGCTPETAKAALEALRDAAAAYTGDSSKSVNDRWHAVNGMRQFAEEELETLGTVRSASDENQCLDEIMIALERAFAEAEAVTGGKVNRLDYIMIGGKTLRGLLTEEVFKKQPELLTRDDVYDTVREMVEAPDAEHVAQIILAAMLAGKKAEFFKMDPNRGYNIINADGRPECEIAKPALLENLDKASLAALSGKTAKKVNLDFNRKLTADENHRRIDICRRAVKRANWLYQVERKSTDSTKARLIELWKQKNKKDGVAPELPDNVAKHLEGCRITYKRGAIPAFVAGYLVSKKKMRVEDIYDPEAKLSEKADAITYIIDLMTSENGTPEEIADIAVNGCIELQRNMQRLIDGIDFNDDSQLFSKKTETLFAMLESAHDLYQDGKGNGRLWDKVLTEKFGCENDPEKLASVNAAITKNEFMLEPLLRLRDNQKHYADLGTGCMLDSDRVKFDLLGCEALRQKFVEKMKNGRGYFNSMTPDEMSKAARVGLECMSRAGTEDEKWISDFNAIMPNVTEESRNTMADMVFGGKLRSDFVISNDDTGVIVTRKERFAAVSKEFKLNRGMKDLMHKTNENVARIEAALKNIGKNGPENPNVQ